jgi:flagellar hook capping protein FlgD
VTLRAILSPPPRRRSTPAWALGLALTLAILGGAAAPSFATVQSIEVVPAAPTSCDSVALVVKGVMPSPCHTLIRARLGELKLLPTMGPVPSYEIGIRIVVQEPNPDIEAACPTVLQPYERKLYLPYHPFGSYRAHATEYLVPYSPDSSAAPKESTSAVEGTFQVAPDSCITPGCYLLAFNGPGLRNQFCDGAGPPGGLACVDITLSGAEPVAGLQSVIHVVDPRLDQTLPLPGSILHPISVEAIGEARGFQVNWTADGSTVRFLLYSTEGKTLADGNRILRVCYSIGSEALPGPYLMRFGATVVSDPRGHAIPPCPTLVEEVGRLCVGDGGCDLDGNGVSNVLDIIRLARCALGGHDSTMVCPDTTAARADCNDDGVVDVRDIVCCIRNILLLSRWGTITPPADPTAVPTRIRFLGAPEWWKPGYGRVEVEMDPGSDFGGAAVEVEAPPGVLIYGMDENDGTVDPGMSPNPYYLFMRDVGDGKRSRFLIVRYSRAYQPQPFRVRLFFQTTDALGMDGVFRIVGAEGGSWSQASPLAAEITRSTVPVGAPAARVLPARPNPFSDATDISFELPAAKHVTLRVYSATGRLVRTLVDATVPLGLHRAAWNGRDEAGRVVASGIYFVKLSTGDVESTIRVMRLR